MDMPVAGSKVRLKGLKGLEKSEKFNDMVGTVKISLRAAAEGRLCVVLDGNF